MPSFQPGGSQTPALSNQESVYRGKDVGDKLIFQDGHPSTRLECGSCDSKKPSQPKSKLAFTWITEVELAKCLEDIADDCDFEELGVKLSKAIEDIIAGESKKIVHVRKTDYSKEGFLPNYWAALPAFQSLRDRWSHAGLRGAPFC